MGRRSDCFRLLVMIDVAPVLDRYCGVFVMAASALCSGGICKGHELVLLQARRYRKSLTATRFGSVKAASLCPPLTRLAHS